MRPILPLLMLGLLAACQKPASPAPPQAVAAAVTAPAVPMEPPPAATPATIYFFDDGREVDARYSPPSDAVLEINGQSHALKIARSGSGARYVGGGLQWWTKGADRGMLAPLKAGEGVASAAGVNCSTQDAPVSPPEPGQPGGLPNDKTPVAEGPFAPDSAQGAADVVQTYYALLGEGKYGQAWALWSGGAPGQDKNAFIKSFNRYDSYHAQVGAPGESEGAAGSSFVEVPVVIYGRLKAGPEVHMRGKVVLRRVNDVDGSTAEQRRWHISQIELLP